MNRGIYSNNHSTVMSLMSQVLFITYKAVLLYLNSANASSYAKASVIRAC